MATFGGLGGLGGSSYPTRTAAPNSQTLSYLPYADEWRDNWQDAYEHWRTIGPSTNTRMVELLPGAADYKPGSAGGSALAEIAAANGGKLPTMYTSTAPTEASHKVAVTTPDLRYLQAPAMLAYLEDKKRQMMPLMEAQTTNQQAFDSMNGWGQQNAVIGPDYTRPNFGTINGDFGQTLMGEPMLQQDRPGFTGGNFADPEALAGMSDPWSWTSGVFNPQDGVTGVYGGSGTADQRRWFL